MVKSQEDILKVILLSTITAVLVGGYVIWKQKSKKKRSYQLPVPRRWRQVGEISKINVYPLKSGKYQSLNIASCTKVGIKEKDTPGKLSLLDRSFVLFDEATHEKLTSRIHPKMLFIETKALDEGTVVFSHPGSDDLVVKLPSSTSVKESKNFVIMWSNEKIMTLDCGDEASDWFTKALTLKSRGRLGYYARDVLPPRSAQIALTNQLKVYPKLDDDYMGSYSDMSSYLIMTHSSMDELNSRLDKPVSELQFRPNIMVKGTKKPFEEDDWDWLKIGEDTVLRSFKRCTRCVLTTIDPVTAVRDPHVEPLKTLRKYRLATDPDVKKLEGQSPAMGIYMGLHRPGLVQIGDPVYVNCDE